MKHLLSLLLTLIILTPAFAQRADSDNLKVIYNHLPSRPLPLFVKTYTVTVVNNVSDYGLTRMERDYLSIKGLTEVPENGDIDISFNIKSFSSSNHSYSKDTKVVVDGKEVTKTVYYYTITTVLDADYKITSGPNHTIEVVNSHAGNTVSVDSKTFDTKAATESDFNANNADIIANNKHSCVIGALQGYRNGNDLNYGYYEITDYIKVATGKGGKQDYSDLDTAMVTFKNAILLYNGKKYDEYFSKAKKCIDIWSKAVKEYDPAVKKARINEKIVSKLYLNLAYANLYLNNFDEAYDAVKKYDTIEEEDSKDLIADIIDKGNRYTMNELRLANKVTFTSKVISCPLAIRLYVLQNKLFMADTLQSIDKINASLIKLLDIARYYPVVVKWRNGTENDYLFNDYEYLKDDKGLITGMRVNYAQSSYITKVVSLNMAGYPIISGMKITTSYANDSKKPVSYDVNLNFQYEDGKIIYFRSNVNTEEFDLQYDNEGRIAKIVDREYSKDPDGGSNNRAYAFEYTGNQLSKEFSGRIAKSAFKPEFENTYTYENNGVVQECIKYKAGKPIPDSKSQFISRKLENNHYKFESIRPNDISTNENIFNENGFVTTKISSWGAKNKTITTYIYSSENAVLESTYEQYINDVLNEKMLTRYYSKTEGVDTRKPYEWQEGKYKFDKDGDWVYEERNNQFRKKENGNWSAWRGFVY